MLEELEISNLGIISHALIPFGPGFNVVTGETGAGKSMVLNSVQLLKGARGSADLVAAKESQCEVVATFLVSPDWYEVHRTELEDRGAILDPRGDGEHANPPLELIISRDLLAQGRSKAFLGGKHVPVTGLSDIGAALIAVHGQAEQAKLRDPQEQLLLLDRAGGQERVGELERFRQARKKWRALVKRKRDLAANRGESLIRLGTLTAAITEIDEVEPSPGEEVDLQAHLAVQRSAESLRSLIETIRVLLTESEGAQLPTTQQLKAAHKEIVAASGLDPRLEVYGERIESVISEVIDIDAELADYSNSLNADPIQLDQMEQRFAAIKSLIKKYGPDIEAVLAWRADAAQQIADLQVSDEDLEQLDIEIEQALVELVARAGELTAARRKTAAKLGSLIERELHVLAMPNAKVRISVQAETEPMKWTRMGADSVEFLIAVHGESQFRAMGKSVSGGELSRLMLAVEVVLAHQDPVPTMIFDEVDAGIGGEVAVEVGRRLSRLAEHTQVIVVTHLPQVAAFAQRHFVVRKEQSTESVSTVITEVTGEDRTREITRMLSGLPDSTSGALHAQELLALAHDL